MEANNTNANNGKKNIINSTVVSGFVATEPKITTCTEASVIRFALAVSNRVTNKATGEVTRQSSLITVEKWAKNTLLNTTSPDVEPWWPNERPSNRVPSSSMRVAALVDCRMR